MDTSKKTDLVLIGKTGNGKSSTGNSIIGSKVFKSTGSMTSVTKDAQFEVCQFEDRIIDVVDAPGTNETDTKEMKAIELVVNAIVKALVLNPEGFHAFLLVVKYGVRHTAEEQTAINILKGILGQSFLKKFGIIVMCGGDTFDFDNENENLTFEDYCSQQDGFSKNLLIECEGRIVLFNNTTRDKAVKYQQVKDLVTMVDQLPSKGKRYTNEHFKAAENERNRLYVTASVPMIEKETLVQHKIILDRIKFIQREFCEHKKIDSFKQLLTQIENLIQAIENKDKGTGALNFVLENVRNSRTTVNDLIESYEDVIRDREEIKTTEEKMENERSAELEKFIDKLEKERAAAKKCREEQMDKLNRQLENQERTYREIKTKETGNYFLGLSDFVSYLTDVFGKIGACAIIGGAVEGAVAGLVLGGPIGAIGGAIGGAMYMAATASIVEYVLKKYR